MSMFLLSTHLYIHYTYGTRPYYAFLKKQTLKGHLYSSDKKECCSDTANISFRILKKENMNADSSSKPSTCTPTQN